MSKGFHLCQSHLLDGKIYDPMAGKPVPFSHEPRCQQTQAPVTLIYQWKSERELPDLTTDRQQEMVLLVVNCVKFL